jgi:hypothetical protein
MFDFVGFADLLFLNITVLNLPFDKNILKKIADYVACPPFAEPRKQTYKKQKVILDRYEGEESDNSDEDLTSFQPYIQKICVEEIWNPKYNVNVSCCVTAAELIDGMMKSCLEEIMEAAARDFDGIIDEKRLEEIIARFPGQLKETSHQMGEKHVKMYFEAEEEEKKE